MAAGMASRMPITPPPTSKVWANAFIPCLTIVLGPTHFVLRRRNHPTTPPPPTPKLNPIPSPSGWHFTNLNRHHPPVRPKISGTDWTEGVKVLGGSRKSFQSLPRRPSTPSHSYFLVGRAGARLSGILSNLVVISGQYPALDGGTG